LDAAPLLPEFAARHGTRDLRKFALSSSAYKRHKLAEAIRHVAVAGYSGIEVVADVPHGYPPLVAEADRRAIRSALAQSRLAVSNVNAAPMTALRDELRPSWLEADQVLRQERIQHTLDAGKFAKDIGGPTISTLGGGELERATPREHGVRRFVAGLRQVASEAAKGKCPPLLIDPQPGLLVETADQAIEVVRQAKSPHIGVTINTDHFQRAGQDVAEAIHALKGLVRHVHLEDTAPDGSGEVVVPGTGVVDFSAVFTALDDIGYDGWLTVDLSGADVHPDEAAKQALRFLGQFDK